VRLVGVSIGSKGRVARGCGAVFDLAAEISAPSFGRKNDNCPCVIFLYRLDQDGACFSLKRFSAHWGRGMKTDASVGVFM